MKSLLRPLFAKLTLALLIAGLMTARPVSADVLSTALPNNGSGGVFFDLTASGANDLSFEGFATYLGSATVGTPASIEVWVRPGSYVGFQGANTGWTLSETVIGFAAGTTTLTPDIFLANAISITQGSTVGIYLHSVTTGNGIRYTGTGAAPPQTVWGNADITFSGAHARTGAVSFGSTVFTPRTFAGNIIYSVSSIPEPASAITMLLLVAGSACLRTRRD